jgi:hypothetical protein
MKILGLIVILLTVAVPAWADPVALPAAALHDRPGVVAVDTQDVTTITFCRSIAWSAYKAPWLHATVSAQDKRVLLLDSSATGGETTLVVWIEGDGMPLQLLVRASAQELGNHLYTVTCPAVTAQVITPAQTPAKPVQPERSQPTNPVTSPNSVRPQAAPATPRAQAAAWDAFTKGLGQQQWDLLTTFVASPNPESQAAFEASLTPNQRAQWAPLAASMPLPVTPSPTGTQAQAAPATPLSLPAWLSWQATAATSGTGMLISYSLQNTGQVTAVLDIARLRITASDGTPIAGVSMTRQDTSGLEGRVPAGGVESGVIRIPAVPQGGVVVSWPVVAVDNAGTTYQISQSLR